MKRLVLALGIILATTPAYARHHHHHHIVRAHNFAVGLGYGLLRVLHDARPHAWCGWWMRQTLGVRDKAFNLASNWAHYGVASSPGVGVVVVWRHHVGRIVGGSSGHWVVESGNDGHAVRRRERSIVGAIAFRQ